MAMIPYVALQNDNMLHLCSVKALLLCPHKCAIEGKLSDTVKISYGMPEPIVETILVGC